MTEQITMERYDDTHVNMVRDGITIAAFGPGARPSDILLHENAELFMRDSARCPGDPGYRETRHRAREAADRILRVRELEAKELSP